MATVNQIYQMVNDSAAEALGSKAIAVKDTATLVSLGDVVLSSETNREAFYNALTERIGRTVIAVRQYKTKNRSVKKDDMEWGLAYQKISFKKRDAVENPSWDTTTQANPYDVEIQTEAVQKMFAVLSTYSFEDSIPDYQLFTAFTNAEAMGAFINGIYINMDNYMTIADEDLANLAVATNIAGVIAKGKASQKRNLLAEYNAKFNKTLTVDACLVDADFLKFASREISLVTKNMEKMSVVFNADGLPRFTPKDKQVVEVLAQFASAIETYLEADTYHNEMVKLPGYEEQAYWQGEGTSGFAFDDVSKINIKNEHIRSNAIAQDGIIAFIHDYDSCGSIITRRRRLSEYNKRAERYNIFDKADTGYMVDLSENAVVFYVA